MRQISVDNKIHIKQLLYTGNVFGVKDDQFKSFGGFQLWWYDKHLDICCYCESHWSDGRKKIHNCSLHKAAKVLWHNRKSLFLRHRHLDEDASLMSANHLVHVGQ